MEIYILREGKETGPFTEEETQTLLKQGSAAIGDLAWQPGMAQWLPLHSVLYPGPAQTTPQRPPPPPEALAPVPVPVEELPPAEAATAKQKAFLTFIGIPFTAETSKDQAALLVNDAMENPKDPARLAKWNADRLRLHPELFPAEVKAKKENRANQYAEIAQREGAGFFHDVTKAHAQVLVGWLDVHHPNWEANEADAARNYFFPAIAEKFPQLVEKSAKGKFKFGASKVGAGVATHPITSKVARKSFPIASIVRGVITFAAIAAVLYYGSKLMKISAEQKKLDDAKLLASTQRAKPETDEIDLPPPKNPRTKPTAAPRTAAQNTALTASTQPGAIPGEPGTMLAPAGDPSMAPGDPAMATAPAAPVELAPVEPPAPEPVPVQPRTTFMITKSTDVALPFGRAKLPPGTLIKIVAVEGTNLRIRYGPDIIVVPISSTDFQAPAAPAPAPSTATAPAAPATPDPLAPPPAAPGAPATGTVKPPTSLF